MTHSDFLYIKYYIILKSILITCMVNKDDAMRYVV